MVGLILTANWNILHRFTDDVLDVKQWGRTAGGFYTAYHQLCHFVIPTVCLFNVVIIAILKNYFNTVVVLFKLFMTVKYNHSDKLILFINCKSTVSWKVSEIDHFCLRNLPVGSHLGNPMAV